ncbi:hypothetical protein [Clostridium neonatale]|uniref:hypothetical protein n=1 Tax=Clostridium neonatale TaxID=137838 RepID=UPI00291C009E|nr:hypothetical protein [Clostridium neonatale]CAI3194211.1 conserved hypothetical protein [Clostridium neonatale]CAI3213991.1 conserved hypothetical protein [Clostridium neonatale]CAI3221531.1 conserved hypothetical protein [Clostridium neonatale]CAI3556059.1 conserved hypothetical protein [Clostridium neonatale]CAI3558307.1 conserved hypothetical protein [Clostridium neonatale]
MENRDSLEYLVNLGEKKEAIIKLDQGTFSRVSLNRVTEPVASKLTVSTLTGLVDYIKTNVDKLEGKLLIQVKSPEEVTLYSPLNADREREKYVSAEAILPNNVVYDRFLDTERFNIMLQSAFVDDEDKSKLLKYTALITDDTVKNFGDDGISQKVTVKTGVVSVSDAVVPNPVTLAPFRTFPEVEQPESKFIFRMKEGPSAALFEADGGAWRNKAILNIKAYLEKELEHNHNVEIIA